MTRFWRRLHIHLGLASCAAALVFAAAGIVGTLHASDDGSAADAPSVRTLQTDIPRDLEPGDLAVRVHAVLGEPLSVPLPGWAVSKDARGHFVFPHHTVNGAHIATLDPDTGLLTVESTRVGLGIYLHRMHAMGIQLPGSGADLRIVLWSVYMEASIFLIATLALSGLWLSLRPRARLRSSVVVVLLAFVGFAVLLGLTR